MPPTRVFIRRTLGAASDGVVFEALINRTRVTVAAVPGQLEEGTEYEGYLMRATGPTAGLHVDFLASPGLRRTARGHRR